MGDSSRSAILAELLDGRALTAGELASRAGVSAATASAHLSRLVEGRLLTVVSQGRYRYFRLAGARVAAALEALAVLAPAPVARDAFEGQILTGLRFARTCYGHLAGRVGVAMRDRLLETKFLCEDGLEHRVSPAGERWFREFGIDLDAVRRSRRSYAKACLDWSERRPHLAGALGDALLQSMLDRDWLRRGCGERAIEVTDAGWCGLGTFFGLSITHRGQTTLNAGAPATDVGRMSSDRKVRR
jgi:DNA-binding transcriptional ArsR family regulator